MQIGSIVAIYILFWVMCAFVVIPFHVRTHEEAGAPLLPGQAESAPYEFPFRRVLWRITVTAAVLFAVFYLNYVYGWLTPEDFSLRH